MVNVWLKIKMKKFYPHIIIFLVLGMGTLSYFLFKAEDCYGSECEVDFGIEEVNTEEYMKYKEMNPKILPEEVLSKKVFLLDVREIQEWEEGHIEGAAHLPLGEINEESTKDFPRDKTIYIYCRSGRRAEEAENIMRTFGFENVVNIGGINDWLERGGKLIK